MIQRCRNLIAGASLLLLFVIPNCIPGEAAVRELTVSTISPRIIIESANRFDKLPEVKFETKEDHYSTYYTTNGMILAGFTPDATGTNFIEPPQYFELQILLRNAQPTVEITTLNPRLARNDFFGGPSPVWLTSIPNYAKVKYSNLYPDVDMLFQVHQRQLDFNFVIAPGGDPKRIRIQVEGAQTLRLTPEGALLLKVHDVIFEVPKPEGYQAFDSSSARAVIEAHYVLTGKNEVGLQIAPYDSNRTLVIQR